MAAFSEYEQERRALEKQFEEGYLNLFEYQRELASINRRERSAIRRLSKEWRGMGLIRSPE